MRIRAKKRDDLLPKNIFHCRRKSPCLLKSWPRWGE
jgi:hypothetical protein